ncbi:MAG TPA: HAMP domain-containing sensor histidine kinase [Solirubrobacterales bacterium]|nr:HAMP domain-containing sensor histidine kinase [Solirubrobacterales bacterium]
MAPAREDSAALAEPNLRAGSEPSRGSSRSDAADGRQPFLGDVRTRVLLSFFVLLVVSTAVSLFVLRQVLISRIDDDVRVDLEAQVDSLRTLAATGSDPETGKPLEGDLERIFEAYLGRERAPEDGFLATFVNGEAFDGEGPEAFPSDLQGLASITEPESGQVSTERGSFQYVAVDITGGNETGVLVAAERLEDERAQVNRAVGLAIAVSVVVTLLASLFIWLAAGRAVQPLRALARTTRTITDTDLSGRVEVRGTDEIGDLGRTFNGMLDRLELAFEDQKEFLADVGHELRTPITVIRGHLETLGDDPAEREEATEVIKDELERMSRLVDDLLLLARSDRLDFLRPEPLDLDLLTHELFAKARTLGVRRWLVDRADVGLIQADPHRITSAVMNLAQNAVKHTRGEDVIAIGSSLEGTEVRIWVRDEGEGIELHEQERIFERFASTGPARPAQGHGHGAGLGLAIVRAIAEAHGGWIELDSAPGRGSTFTIVIPAEGSDEQEEDLWHAS